jgi:hypothetical protein
VAACNKAETGVGPSIASGNQVCNPICADLATHPINININIISNVLKLKNMKLLYNILIYSTNKKIFKYSNVPICWYIIKKLNISPKSPTRFIITAFIEDFIA